MVLVSDEGQVSLENAPGTVFQLLDEFGVVVPEYEKLRAGYYGTLTLSTFQVAQFRKETLELRDLYQAKRRCEVLKQRKIHARDPRVVDRIVAQILEGDPWLLKFDEIIALCERAVERAGTITCVGD